MYFILAVFTLLVLDNRNKSSRTSRNIKTAMRVVATERYRRRGDEPLSRPLVARYFSWCHGRVTVRYIWGSGVMAVRTPPL